MNTKFPKHWICDSLKPWQANKCCRFINLPKLSIAGGSLRTTFCFLDRRLDHAALAVGYGEENGQEYWLIKNSWSLSWGSEGFIKISARNDNCGVTQKAVVVEVKKKSWWKILKSIFLEDFM